MPKYILVKPYYYDMSNNSYEDYQPIITSLFYDNLEEANQNLIRLKNDYHIQFGNQKEYKINEDDSYYSEKYNQTVYPPELFKVAE